MRRYRELAGRRLAVLGIAGSVLLAGPAADAAACDGVWRAQRLPSAVVAPADLAATASGDLWLVGGNRIAHRASGYWSVDRLGERVSLQAVAAKPRAVWAVGRQASRPLIVHRSGSSWRTVAAAPAGSVLVDVSVSSADNVWVAGHDDRGAFALQFDGSRWLTHRLPRSAHLTSVDTTGERNTWVVGESDGYRSMSWRWNGDVWQRGVLSSPGYDVLGTSVVVALPYGRAWTTVIADSGTCCHDAWAALRRGDGRWQPVAGRKARDYFTPVDLLVNGAETTATVIGLGSSDTGGGGHSFGIIQRWTGTAWVEELIEGHTNPLAENWSLTAIDGDGRGNRWVSGTAPGGTARLVHQCLR